MARLILALAAALALAGCNPAQKAPPAPAEATSGEFTGVDMSRLEGRIVALGAAPAWRLDADAGLGLILVQGDETISADFARPTADGAGGARLVSGDLDLGLRGAPCTQDGAAYPMTAALSVRGGAPMQGCAFVRWDHDLTALLPAIDSCLSLTTDETPLRVTYAGREADGRTLVRMRNADGAYDCRTGGTEDAEIALTDPALRIGGESAAIFLRAPGENPGGQCYQAPEVRGADGTLIGWWDDPEGC